MIFFSLLKNKLLTAIQAPYLAKTMLDGALNYENTLKALAYGSTATLADIKAVLENIERVCIENLAQGRSVNLGFCSLRPQVKGVFQSPEDSFSKDKNWIAVTIIPSPLFCKKVTLEAKTLRVAQVKTLPLLTVLENHTSGSNSTLANGELISLRGENLRFDKSEPLLGVFFEKDGLETKAIEYSQISGKSVSFKTPVGLISGQTYKVKLKNKFGSDIRVGELDYEVQAA